MRIDNADTGLAGVRYHQPFSVGARGEEVRINANRNRGDDAMRLTIPYDHVIGRKIGHISVAIVRAQRRQMRALAGRDFCDDLMITGADHRDVSRHSIGHISKPALVIKSDMRWAEDDLNFTG